MYTIPPPERKKRIDIISDQICVTIRECEENVEAAPGIEPGIRDLQSLALPLGYAALIYLSREDDARASRSSNLQLKLRNQLDDLADYFRHVCNLA